MSNERIILAVFLGMGMSLALGSLLWAWLRLDLPPEQATRTVSSASCLILPLSLWLAFLLVRRFRRRTE